MKAEEDSDDNYSVFDTPPPLSPAKRSDTVARKKSKTKNKTEQDPRKKKLSQSGEKVLSSRSKWTSQEEEELKRLVKKYKKDWDKIASKMPGRTRSACQKKLSFLEPSVKRRRVLREWTEKEDALLQQMDKAGDSWAEIAEAFPHRTLAGLTKRSSELRAKERMAKSLSIPNGSLASAAGSMSTKIAGTYDIRVPAERMPEIDESKNENGDRKGTLPVSDHDSSTGVASGNSSDSDSSDWDSESSDDSDECDSTFNSLKGSANSCLAPNPPVHDSQAMEVDPEPELTLKHSIIGDSNASHATHERSILDTSDEDSSDWEDQKNSVHDLQLPSPNDPSPSLPSQDLSITPSQLGATFNTPVNTVGSNSTPSARELPEDSFISRELGLRRAFARAPGKKMENKIVRQVEELQKEELEAFRRGQYK
ncbi:hypothetical protein T439DRAFT_381937 [Meredithblackwellia eburnea MCA 4105]